MIAVPMAAACLAGFLTACTGQGHAVRVSPRRADGTLVGHLYAVGGAAPGLPRPLPGTVTVTGSGFHRDVRIGTSGAFSVEIPVGRYTVVGHSPLYGSGQYLCQATAAAMVTSDHATKADVLCQER